MLSSAKGTSLGLPVEAFILEGRIKVSHLFAAKHTAPASHKEVEWLVNQTKVEEPSQTPTQRPSNGLSVS